MNEKNYEISLPPLPTGDDILSEAVRSVNRRGFHEHIPVAAFDALLMAQFVRLTEEVGEYATAKRLSEEAGKFAIADLYQSYEEAADAVIVCAQMLWLLNGAMVDKLTYLHEQEAEDARTSELLGDVARALRSEGGNPVFALHMLMHKMYRTVGRDKLNMIIAEKLTADERRGMLHNGNGAAPVMVTPEFMDGINNRHEAVYQFNEEKGIENEDE